MLQGWRAHITKTFHYHDTIGGRKRGAGCLCKCVWGGGGEATLPGHIDAVGRHDTMSLLQSVSGCAVPRATNTKTLGKASHFGTPRRPHPAAKGPGPPRKPTTNAATTHPTTHTPTHRTKGSVLKHVADGDVQVVAGTVNANDVHVGCVHGRHLQLLGPETAHTHTCTHTPTRISAHTSTYRGVAANLVRTPGFTGLPEDSQQPWAST